MRKEYDIDYSKVEWGKYLDPDIKEAYKALRALRLEVDSKIMDDVDSKIHPLLRELSGRRSTITIIEDTEDANSSDSMDS